MLPANMTHDSTSAGISAGRGVVVVVVVALVMADPFGEWVPVGPAPRYCVVRLHPRGGGRASFGADF